MHTNRALDSSSCHTASVSPWCMNETPSRVRSDVTNVHMGINQALIISNSDGVLLRTAWSATCPFVLFCFVLLSSAQFWAKRFQVCMYQCPDCQNLPKSSLPLYAIFAHKEVQMPPTPLSRTLRTCNTFCFPRRQIFGQNASSSSSSSETKRTTAAAGAAIFRCWCWYCPTSYCWFCESV